MKKLLLILSLLFSGAVSAHTVNLLDTVVDMPLPENYCVLSQNTDFYRFNETALGSSVKILLIASDCDAVKAVNEGREKTLSHYVAMEQIGIKDRFIRFTFGDIFYVNLIRAFRLKDLSKYEYRVNEKLEEQNVALSSLKAVLVTADDSSLTYRASAVMNGFGKKTRIDLNGVTFLYRDLPFAIHTYDEEAGDETHVRSLTEILTLKSKLR